MKIFIFQEPRCFTALEQIMADSHLYAAVQISVCIYIVTHTCYFSVTGFLVLQAVRGRDTFV